jgi:Ca-activated chloride channel family protein
MTWFSSFSVREIILLAIFGLFYLAFFLRAVRIAKAMGTAYSKLFVKLILRTIYFALFIVALLGPSFGESKREIKAIGKDIMIAVDLSESMNAFDVQPTRLEKLKFELKNIIDAFSSDRIGLIIFANDAFVQCPLTYDKAALGLFIETLNTEMIPNSGTDFGPPLKLAVAKLQNKDAPMTKQTSKVIILISDGEDFGDNTQDVASEIESLNIKLFTLGIGTDRGSKIMTRRGFKKDKEGNDVVSYLSSNSLKKVAASTGGKYFEINDSKNDVSRLINTIGLIEGELTDVKQIDVSANKYYYFLLIGLMLMILDVLLNIKTIRI